MKVRLTRTVRLHQSVLRNSLELLLPHNGPMQFIEERKPLMFEEDNFKWNDFFSLCTKYRSENSFEENDFLIVLTELKNNDNWFSCFSFEGERTVFIHAEDWENYIYCEPSYPIAYQIIGNIFHSMLSSENPDNPFAFFHEEPLGCMSDMCGWKVDISLKLRTADICTTCLDLLSEVAEEGQIRQCIDIFESLRKKMLFNRSLQKPLSFEENLPFTVAITKRKMSTTLEPFRKLLMLIDHFDSIVRTAVITIAHLNKTKEQVEIFLEEKNLSNLPSLGSWVEALAILSRQTKNNNWDFQLPMDFSNNVKQVVQLANDAKITYIRNEKRGHGYIECQDSSYREQFQKCLPAIEEMEKLLSPLFYRFKYYHVINYTRVSGNKFKIICHDLSGSNPAFIEEEITSNFYEVDDIPIKNHVHLVTPDKTKWFNLEPYLKYGECNLCHHNRLLVFDGIYMLDPYIGHRFKRENEAS